MTFIFWTIATATIAAIALIYIIRLSVKRKDNVDFPIHLFVAMSVFIISSLFTAVQVFELSLKWTDNAPTITGACTIDVESKSTSIYFEQKNLYLSTFIWSSAEPGYYEHCKATYYPISKQVIEFEYE